MTEQRGWDIAVVGGGAAGLMAALTAGRSGKRVVVLDRNREPGRKILVSGNGRCNLTNLTVSPKHYPLSDPAFVGSVLSGLGPEWLRKFFRDLGLETVAEGERVWPASFEARSVRDRLVAACAQAGVELVTNIHVDAIDPDRDGFRVATRSLEAGETSRIHCGKLILAAGGKSYGNLGATDSGYTLATRLGHRVTPLYPGLVPLRTDVAVHHKLQGLKVVADIALVEQTAAGNREIARCTGDLLFADYGVSGQAVLNLSCLGAESLAAPEKAGLSLSVNFLPGRTAAEAASWLGERRDRHPEDPVLHDLEGFLPRKLAAHVLRTAAGTGTGASSDRRMEELGDEEMALIAEAITAFTVPLRGTLAFGKAMITLGGVETSEVAPETMISRLVPGLALAGEVLDVQGLSGGFNLHFAFASGFRAGTGAS